MEVRLVWDGRMVFGCSMLYSIFSPVSEVFLT